VQELTLYSTRYPNPKPRSNAKLLGLPRPPRNIEHRFTDISTRTEYWVGLSRLLLYQCTLRNRIILWTRWLVLLMGWELVGLLFPTLNRRYAEELTLAWYERELG
jgi:hypothetical protein